MSESSPRAEETAYRRDFAEVQPVRVDADAACLAASFQSRRDGAADTTFGGGGVFGMTGRAYGLATDGRQLIVVGTADASDHRRARIARLWL